MTKETVFFGKAQAILRKLDSPRRKSDTPIKPFMGEMFGFPKAGKDRQLVELDRYFRRNKFQVLIHQESAEAENIRRVPREHSYVYQMQHFAYSKEFFDRFDKVTVIKKNREILTSNGLLMHRDRVENLGDFTEIIGMPTTNDGEIMEAAERIGLGQKYIAEDSYIRIFLKSVKF